MQAQDVEIVEPHSPIDNNGGAPITPEPGGKFSRSEPNFIKAPAVHDATEEHLIRQPVIQQENTIFARGPEFLIVNSPPPILRSHLSYFRLRSPGNMLH